MTMTVGVLVVKRKMTVGNPKVMLIVCLKLSKMRTALVNSSTKIRIKIIRSPPVERITRNVERL